MQQLLYKHFLPTPSNWAIGLISLMLYAGLAGLGYYADVRHETAAHTVTGLLLFSPVAGFIRVLVVGSFLVVGAAIASVLGFVFFGMAYVVTQAFSALLARKQACDEQAHQALLDEARRQLQQECPTTAPTAQ